MGAKQGSIYAKNNYQKCATLEMEIIANKTALPLAKKIHKVLSIKVLNTRLDKFLDGELQITLDSGAQNESAVILHCFDGDVNASYVELFFTIHTARRIGYKQIFLILPYFAYSRQDQSASGKESVGLTCILDLLSACHIERIAAIDLHSPITNTSILDTLTTDQVLKKHIEMMHKKNLKNMVLVAPDEGRKEQVMRLGQQLGMSCAVITKVRNQHNVPKATALSGSVSGKIAYIVDDIVVSGQTMLSAASLLKKHGASEVHAFVTHWKVPSAIDQDELVKSFSSFTTTNSTSIVESSLVTVLDLSSSIAEYIGKLWTKNTF